MKYFLQIAIFTILLSCGAIQAQNFKTHKVKSGETIESIAKQYNVTAKDIYGLNPDVKGALKPDAILIIPKEGSSASTSSVVRELQGFKDHRTRRKETLFSISQKYNVDIEDIKKHNTFLYANNLRKGDKLKIPVYRTKTVVALDEPETPTNSTTTETTTASLYTTPYIVKPKDDLHRIAYKFNTSIEKIKSLNPEFSGALKVADIIKVPKIEDELQREVSDDYTYYSVKPKQGFYSLEKQFALTQEKLETLNPELKTSGLKAGMIIRLPGDVKVETVDEMILEEGNKVDLTTLPISSEQKHIAVMLPFKLNRVSVDSISDVKVKLTEDPFLSAATDFHSGVLMAFAKAEKLGVNAQVDVYDTQNQASKVSSIIATNNFDTVDAVIGPLMTTPFNQAVKDLRSKHIPVIAPLSRKVSGAGNAFQSRPTDKLLKQKIINYVKADSTIANIVIIADSKHKTQSDALKKIFPQAKQMFSRKDSKTKKDEYYVLNDDVLAALKPGRNVVFLETKKPGFVSNASSILNAAIDDKIKIQLVTTNKNKAFDSDEVSNNHLSNLEFCYPSVSKDYDLNSDFVKAYKEKYGITPNKIAVRGYDVTMDVLLRLATTESIFESVTENEVTEYIENKFGYEKQLTGGYYNNAVYIVKYKDLKLVEVK